MCWMRGGTCITDRSFHGTSRIEASKGKAKGKAEKPAAKGDKKVKRKGEKTQEADSTANASSEPSDAFVDMEAVTAKFEDVLARFARVANDARMGKTSPLVFDNLKVHIDGEDVPYPTVATTSIKGRNFLITLFDPQYANPVINAILGSNLNMNAQADPSNNYTLRSPLPPITTESKNESVKQLKQSYENYKNGLSKFSLSSIRADVKQKFKTVQRKSDDDTRLMNDFDKLHKKYTDKLLDSFKQAEIAILK